MNVHSVVLVALFGLSTDVVLAQGGSCPADGSPDYVYQSLTGLEDRPFSATALNDLGQVAGRVTLNDGSHAAFVWQAGALQVWPFPDSVVTVEDLTEDGLVLGTVRPIAQNETEVFLWDSVAGEVELVRVPFALFPSGVNADEWIVGIDADGLFGWVLDAATGEAEVVAFGPPPAMGVGTSGTAAINDAGVAVGGEVVFVDTDGGFYQELPYRWTDADGIEPLGTVPGGFGGRAVDVSANGRSAGTVFDEFFAHHAALWDAEGDLTNLGSPFGFFVSDALALNDAGQVVVVAPNDLLGFTRGFLWEEGQYTDLSCFAPSGLFVTRPLDINADGDVLVQLTDNVGLAIVEIGLLIAQGESIPAQEVVRLGSPPNPAAFLPGVTSGPVVGATWDPVIGHGTFAPDAILDVVVITPTPTNVPIAGLGTLLCDLALLLAAPNAPVPGAPFAIPIPANPALLGAALCTQGASIVPGGGALANALDIVVGDS